MRIAISKGFLPNASCNMNLDGGLSNQSSVLLLGFARHLKQYYKVPKLLPPKLHD